MKILLVENDASKATSITSVVAAELHGADFEVTRSSTINDALVRLSKDRFDLVIVDLVLPQTSGGAEVDATGQWCELIENHLAGRTASWVVMTAHADVVPAARDSFARHDVAVISYDETQSWKDNLSRKIRHNQKALALDFVIVCALAKERNGFLEAECTLGDLENLSGLDCQRLAIGKLRGVVVVQPAPGMISAAIVATKALSLFRPRAIAMAGICGGRAGEAQLGSLIVPDLSWNYQSGKFVDGKLTADLLQVSVPPSVKTELGHLTTDEVSQLLRRGLMHSELQHAPILMRPMVSGSQVVADNSVSHVIGDQGRKVAGIDMEAASILFAGHDFFNGGGIYFAAKAVVDLANPDKDDRYHEYGCALAARFVVEALKKLLG